MAMTLHSFRIDDEAWARASAQAADNGEQLTSLIRQWVEDYADDKKRRPVRITAAERKAAREAVYEFSALSVDAVIEAINAQR